MGVVVAKSGLGNLDGSLQLSAGAVQVAQAGQQMAEVVPGGNVGVAGAEGGLTDFKGLFVVGTGGGQVPKLRRKVPRLLCQVAGAGEWLGRCGPGSRPSRVRL
jgi:hypothetical protein